jgi:hypothetical protein
MVRITCTQEVVVHGVVLGFGDDGAVEDGAVGNLSIEFSCTTN